MSAVVTGTRVATVLAATAARLAAAGCVSAEAEARWLLEETLATPPGALHARRGEPLPAAAAERLERMVARRVAGDPLQYVIGWAPFGPQRLEVGPGVFVPRPETELVAERAAWRLSGGSGGLKSEAPGGVPGSEAKPSVSPPVDRRAHREGRAPVAVDVCTGSGAIARFLAGAVPAARVLATEVDPGALVWARRNLSRCGVELLEGDLDEPLPTELEGRVDVLVGNVPYVPASAIRLLPRDVREHEPRLALDGGPDGLDVLRRLAVAAPRWLAPGGWLVCEIGEDQGGAAAGVLAAAGLVEVSVRPDLTGRDRMVEGRRP